MNPSEHRLFSFEDSGASDAKRTRNAASSPVTPRSSTSGAEQDPPTNEVALSSDVFRRALVIEDSAVDQILLREALLEINHDVEVRVVETIDDACSLISDSSFDVIFLDLSLPDTREFSGLSVIARSAPHSPIVVLASVAEKSLHFEALSHGADGVVDKDELSIPVLRETITNALRRRSGPPLINEEELIAAAAFEELKVPSAIIDRTGLIVSVNHTWRELELRSGVPAGKTGVGANYLTTCDHASDEFAKEARDVARGIRSVLVGDINRFSCDYYCPFDGQDHWRSVRVVAAGEYAHVSHIDITDVRLSEQMAGDENHGATHHVEQIHADEHSDEPRVFALLDVNGNVLERSLSTRNILGTTDFTATSFNGFANLVPADVQKAHELLARLVAKPMASEQVELRVYDERRRQHILDLRATNRLDDPDIKAITVIGHDVTNRKFASIARNLESRLLERLPAAVIVYDECETIVYWNQSAEEIYGFSKDDAIGRNMSDLGIRHNFAHVVGESLAEYGSWEGTYDARRADATLIPVRAKVENIHIEELDFHGTLSASIDIRDLRELEDQLAYQARHDSQSGLPNRRLFLEHLDAVLIRSRETSKSLAVVLVEFEEKAAVHGRTGLASREDAMEAWARTFSNELRPDDFLAHFGGTEFALCMEYLDSSDEAIAFAAQLVEHSRTPLSVGMEKVPYALRVGVVLVWRDANADELLRGADIAMSSASQLGFSNYGVFDATSHDELVRRSHLRDELINAIENDAIKTYFQPVVSLSTGEIIGFEALARWRHLKLGAISPDEFIPLAEESGLIDAIFKSVLRTTCQALRTWRSLRLNNRITVALNLSPTQINETIVGVVQEVLLEEDIDPGQLCIEITESSMTNPETALSVLQGLKELGVQLALDDFGTGYSSMLRLHEYPFDYMKIDKGMVATLPANGEESTLIKAIMGIAAVLDLRIVAEGIEVEAQRETLQRMGCKIGQGFLWSRAVDFTEATSLLCSKPASE
jgi:diguanylate cyclase (GGDEF)-like protein/PAS domain S-box-containing protein